MTRIQPPAAQLQPRSGFRLALVAAAVSGLLAGAPVAAQVQFTPAEQTAAAVADPEWEVARFSWGDPILEGTFTSRDMSGIPMERPPQYGNRAALTDEEFRARVGATAGGLGALVEAARANTEDRLQLSALDSAETGTRTFGYTSYIIDPPDGRIPALTAAGRERMQNSRNGQANGPFYTTADFSFYDRCVTRGVTGSILPSLYGDAIRVVQSPTEVAISYEMLHDTRIIPLDGRAPADAGVSQFMGAAVGHFEGDTLVVTTTNFTDRLTIGRMPHSSSLVLTERFRRTDEDMLDYTVEVNDPETFTAPWTFRLTLTTQPDYEILEYSCHEGNFFVRNALRAESEYQARARASVAAGDGVPPRETAAEGGGLVEIYEAPDAADAIDINATQ